MLGWLAVIAVLALLWAGLWRISTFLGFGILLGLPVAWLLSRPLAPYLTGMEHVPIWLPPLPFALVALALLVLGALSWFRASSAPGPADSPEESDQH